MVPVMNNKLNILILHLEFSSWQVAKSWSYETQLGIFDGFNINSIRLSELLNPYGGLPFKKSFGTFIKKLINNRKFDQVWVEVVHSDYDDDFLSFIQSLAPVRVALICESLLYTKEDCGFAPILSERYTQVKRKLEYFTHVLTVDEADVNLIESDSSLNALWWVPGIPLSTISPMVFESEFDSAIFSGPSYGNRLKFIEHSELSKYMLHLPPLELNTKYPLIFDYMQFLFKSSIFLSSSMAVKFSDEYVKNIKDIRSKLFESWICGLRRGSAVVQLPHFVKAFPGRVYEGIAAGKPVITMLLKDRPQTMQLFEHGKEILYYKEDPGEIVDILKKLQKDKNYGNLIANNALKKLRKLHTTKTRIKQVVHWIETGDKPEYYCME